MLTSNMPFTSDQLDQLKSLGLDLSNTPTSTSRHLSLLPLLSISGLSLISFGGLLLFKSKESASVPSLIVTPPHQAEITPTQVPKSIQHYLLTSQQYFSQALTAQTAKAGNLPDLLNQSILTATDAITDFPTDFRGYQQRGSIYLSLVDSQPQFLPSAIADFSEAAQLNPADADICRSLATLYAKKGDTANTLNYLARTIAIEPTKAQNFYDLAKLQQQVGLIPQALDTYSKLLTLITDPSQKQQVQTEVTSLQKLASQNTTSNPTLNSPSVTPNPPTGGISLPDHPNLIQASTGSGLIIAAPQTSKDISVSNLSDSNALSGTSTLPANTASISISNTNLLPSSPVYVVKTLGGANQSLQVLSKSKNSFVVGLDSPISEPIEFKWWIVN